MNSLYEQRPEDRASDVASIEVGFDSDVDSLNDLFSCSPLEKLDIMPGPEDVSASRNTSGGPGEMFHLEAQKSLDNQEYKTPETQSTESDNDCQVVRRACKVIDESVEIPANAAEEANLAWESFLSLVQFDISEYLVIRQACKDWPSTFVPLDGCESVLNKKMDQRHAVNIHGPMMDKPGTKMPTYAKGESAPSVSTRAETECPSEEQQLIC